MNGHLGTHAGSNGSANSTGEEEFEIMTSLAYKPPLNTPETFFLLPRHLRRLKVAHAGLGRELPHSWCAEDIARGSAFPSDEEMLKVLENAVTHYGITIPQRVRLTISKGGKVSATTSALPIMPFFPVRLVLDTHSSSYDDPFLRYKTTHRKVYEDARNRVGASYLPSSEPTDAPFDVLMYNAQEEMTETSISNVAFCLNSRDSTTFITPKKECGLLEGVLRSELLERGQMVEGVVKLKDVKQAAEDGTLKILCFNGVRGKYDAYLTFRTPLPPTSAPGRLENEQIDDSGALVVPDFNSADVAGQHHQPHSHTHSQGHHHHDGSGHSH